MPEAAIVETTEPTAPISPVEPAEIQTESIEKPVDAGPSMDADLQQVWDKLHPPRSEDGKFVSKEAKEDSAVQPAKTEPEPATPAIDVPNSWTAEAKARWDKVPRDVQEYIAQREAESHKAITRAGEERKSVEPILQTIEQFKDVIAENNIPPHDAIARMFAVERWLRQDAKAAINGLAEAYGVNLSGNSANAEVSAQQPDLSGLKQEVAQLKSYLTAQQRAEHDRTQAAYEREIAEFAKDKPHFESVRTFMAGLMQSGSAKDLPEAYEMATNAHPDIRKQLQTEQKKADEEKRLKEAADKVKDAKKAAGLNVKSSTASGESKKSMDDDMMAIWRKNHG